MQNLALDKKNLEEYYNNMFDIRDRFMVERYSLGNLNGKKIGECVEFYFVNDLLSRYLVMSEKGIHYISEITKRNHKFNVAKFNNKIDLNLYLLNETHNKLTEFKI